MIKKALVLNIVLVLVLSSCSFFNFKDKEDALARVYDNYIYYEDIKGIIPENSSKKDSAQILKNYIDNWVIRQLLLRKAELNLPDEELDVNRELEMYRSSLLIYKYEQELIKQKLDTAVSDQQVREYYEENKLNFILRENIVKFLYVKINDSVADRDELRRLIRSDDNLMLKELETICYNHAEKYDYCDSEWFSLSFILNQADFKIKDEEKILRQNRILELKDRGFLYFVKIFDYKQIGDFAPMNYVRNDIIEIIINKRRIRFFDKLESDIYQSALNYNNFEIY